MLLIILALLCFMAAPASAVPIFTTFGPSITDGLANDSTIQPAFVSNTFAVVGAPATVASIQFGQLLIGGTLTSVDWEISSDFHGAGGNTVFASGVAAPISDNGPSGTAFGYFNQLGTFDAPVVLAPGNYFLTLSNVVDSSGQQSYWTYVNNPNSTAYFDSATFGKPPGTPASDIVGTNGGFLFQVNGTQNSVPELDPTSATGALALCFFGLLLTCDRRRVAVSV